MAKSEMHKGFGMTGSGPVSGEGLPARKDDKVIRFVRSMPDGDNLGKGFRNPNVSGADAT